MNLRLSLDRPGTGGPRGRAAPSGPGTASGSLSKPGKAPEKAARRYDALSPDLCAV